MIDITVAGWRLVPHSYSIVSDFQCLSMLAHPDLALSYEDVPYLAAHWRRLSGLFDAGSESALRRIPAPPPRPVDVLYRTTYPYNLAPSGARTTCVFATCEWGVLVPGAGDLPPGSSLRSAPEAVIVTPSQWSRQGLIRSGADPSQVTVVPHGVDTSVFKPCSAAERAALRQRFGWDGFVFLNLGGMSGNKGIDLLLQAFAQVLRTCPEALLVLKGLDALYPSRKGVDLCLGMLPAAERAKVQDRLAYVGSSLSFEEVAALYQAADAYVSPYLAEGFNLPVLEAAASGLPVICTRGGPTDEFTDASFARRIDSRLRAVDRGQGRFGFALMPQVEHLVELMRAVMDQPDYRLQARESGPAFVRAGWTWRHSVDRLLNVLEATLSGDGQPGLQAGPPSLMPGGERPLWQQV